MFKKKEAARVSEYRLKKMMSEKLEAIAATSTSATTSTTSSGISKKQILSQSVEKTEISHPSSPRKKDEVIGTLAKKSSQRIALHNKSERKKSE